MISLRRLLVNNKYFKGVPLGNVAPVWQKSSKKLYQLQLLTPMSSAAKMKSTSIPLVDIGNLGLEHDKAPSEAELKRVGKQICDAFSHIGFVYIANHGIPEDKLQRLVNAGKDFFDLPVEEKDKVKFDLSINHGYHGIDTEHTGGLMDNDTRVYELRESYNMTQQERIYPDESAPDLKPASVDFMNTGKKLILRILDAIAVGLDQEQNFFSKTHQGLYKENNLCNMKVLHYPPVPHNLPPGSLRCDTHIDFGTLTFLFQDEDGGLDVRDRDGNWIKADYIPGTILINVGHIFQYWTADKFIATEHRVLIPDEKELREKARRTVVLFSGPDNDVILKPINGSSKYKPLTTLEYVQIMSEKLYGKKFG